MSRSKRSTTTPGTNPRDVLIAAGIDPDDQHVQEDLGRVFLDIEKQQTLPLDQMAKMAGVTGTHAQLVTFATMIELNDRSKHHLLNLKRIHTQLGEMSRQLGITSGTAIGTAKRLHNLERVFYDVLTEEDRDLAAQKGIKL